MKALEQSIYLHMDDDAYKAFEEACRQVERHEHILEVGGGSYFKTLRLPLGEALTLEIIGPVIRRGGQA